MHAPSSIFSATPSATASPSPGKQMVAGRNSWQSRLLNLGLQLAVRRSMAGRSLADVPAMRARLDHMGGRQPLPKHIVHTADDLGGVPAEWTRAAGVSDAQRTVLYLHGGAFLVGSPRMYRGVTAELAHHAAADVVAIDYRLAPEHPFPAALQDAEAAYRALLARGQSPSQLVVMGDSAGGNLALALLQTLRSIGLPMPAAAVLLSPWLDLSADYDLAARYVRRDPMLPAARIREAAALYTGAAASSNPLISPLQLDFTDLPPLLMHAGGRELLLPAMRLFAERARSAGADLQFREWDGMPHVFQAFARLVPEARSAMADLTRFVIDRVPTGVRDTRAASTGTDVSDGGLRKRTSDVVTLDGLHRASRAKG